VRAGSLRSLNPRTQPRIRSMSNAMIKPSREYLQIKSLADAHARMTPCEIGYQMNDLPQNLPKNIRLDEDATPRMGSKQIKFHPDTTFGMRARDIADSTPFITFAHLRKPISDARFLLWGTTRTSRQLDVLDVLLYRLRISKSERNACLPRPWME
jgi:hypothetical protein